MVDPWENSSCSDFLIAMLGSGRNKSLFYKKLYEQARTHKKQDAYLPLYRLRKNGFVERHGTAWQLTKKGEGRAEDVERFALIASPFKSSGQKNILIAFDIPETHRRKRQWLRDQLKIFGYVMLQKSLWQGPGPLPKEFSVRLKKLTIEKNIKIFNIKKREAEHA